MSQSRYADKLQSSNALILGGTSGVGLAVARALLEQNVNVIISSSRQTKLDEALESLRNIQPTPSSTTTSGQITGFVCDLSGPAVESNLQTLRDQVTTYLSGKPLNHLIYTAGDHLPTMTLDEVTVSKFTSVIHVRAIAALLAVKTFHPLLLDKYTSSITLTSGSISQKPIAGGWSVLSFVGAGLTGMTRQLAMDLAPVRVNCVAPGVVDTDLWKSLDPEAKRELFEGYKKVLPTGRVPRAEDLAESYVYFARDWNVTGHVVHSNGGAFLV